MTSAPGDGRARHGDVSFARHFARLFSCAPQFLGDPVDVPGGGHVAIARYVHNGIASVVTLGLERVSLPGGARIELLCEVVETQKAAAEVTVRIALQRVMGALGDAARGPFQPGDVWINDVPFLAGTRIQAIVGVDAQWSGRDQNVHDENGAVVGWVNEVVMLTRNEGKRVAVDGIVPLIEAAAAAPAARFDVLRDDMVEPPAPVPREPCLVTLDALERGVRWMQRDADGRYLAISLTESAEYLADPENFTAIALAEIVVGVPSLRGFAARAQPGEYAMLEGDVWSFGALSDSGAPAAGTRPNPASPHAAPRERSRRDPEESV
ncbi:hypothetical protein GCM10011490_22020 [Pseudoclavibacter endophyticus]|uniref:Uncharacterized protein n=1 Tax=Pseudoclavibacter endophyticus TaxID=1778590 RepID=A0A6H9WQD4_9MICO|nr:hypothetical protein [Pseudoclavibacter endophyticus]KAB1648245.1 hypothetical protein F8O04_11065 [Pseudoclavibacter endophyticus]GGA70961.1 hypothetical protein GCM10011490_22020 [Pseudoclavibacter endophyticus]